MADTDDILIPIDLGVRGAIPTNVDRVIPCPPFRFTLADVSLMSGESIESMQARVTKDTRDSWIDVVVGRTLFRMFLRIPG
jgi:hypothetical protein